MSWLDAVIAQTLAGRMRVQAVARSSWLFPLYYTPLEATDLDHILTILGRIVTSMVRIGPS